MQKFDLDNYTPRKLTQGDALLLAFCTLEFEKIESRLQEIRPMSTSTAQDVILHIIRNNEEITLADHDAIIYEFKKMLKVI